MDRRRAGSLAAVVLVVVLAVGGPPDAHAAATARVVDRGSRAVHSIALTFDDGSSPQNCRRILAELVDRGVPATFFPMSSALRLDPAFWQLVAKAGYPIGDHTVTHPHLPRLGYTDQLRQLTRSRAMLESTIGRPILDVFRPPYGEFNANTRIAAAAAGFPTLLLWDIDPRDWSAQASVDEKLAAAEEGVNGSVVLLHCGPNVTPYLVPDVIAAYRRQGFRFVTVPTLLGLAWKPGPTASVSAEEILGSLSPLPPAPGGGAVVGVNGSFPPDPSPPGLPSPTPAPSPSIAASPSPPPSAAAAEPASPGTEPTRLTASPVASPGTEVGFGFLASESVVAILGATGLAVVAVLLSIVGLRRRRRT